MLWPIRIVSGLWQNAALIDSDSSITLGWRLFLIIFTVLMIAHILLAWYCGGKLRHFFWPFLAPLSIRLIAW